MEKVLEITSNDHIIMIDKKKSLNLLKERRIRKGILISNS